MNVRSTLCTQLRRLVWSTSSCEAAKPPSRWDDCPEVSNAVGAVNKRLMGCSLFSESYTDRVSKSEMSRARRSMGGFIFLSVVI